MENLETDPKIHIILIYYEFDISVQCAKKGAGSTDNPFGRK